MANNAEVEKKEKTESKESLIGWFLGLELIQKILLIAGIVITILGIVFSGYLFGWNSVFNQNISNNVALNTAFQKIPALIKTIQIITVSFLAFALAKALMLRFLSKSKRGKTITTLATSFFKYLIAIIAIMMILSAWGADPGALLASAGILTLVIGLGAQSLIADILAGIFIVFEGEFQVGDIIVIDGWRGTVTEVGIRTTKVIDWGGNVRIINNSSISSIINQTKELSIAVSRISIEYGQPIPDVEVIIKNNLERMKNAIPEIVEGPYYKGVDALSSSSVDLLFMAKCKEEDLYGVQRALNRELKILFDENGIRIPFPQVTVSQYEDSASESGRAAVEDEARQFTAEQRAASKDMEDRDK
ncbi:MAG: mechanosensitive ion channel family protein [Clostridia bacterium]|nr:mechanosensitive ion channel family protein [Clostridia bacterium]